MGMPPTKGYGHIEVVDKSLPDIVMRVSDYVHGSRDRDHSVRVEICKDTGRQSDPYRCIDMTKEQFLEFASDVAEMKRRIEQDKPVWRWDDDKGGIIRDLSS
mgnify:CR=1 FL=1